MGRKGRICSAILGSIIAYYMTTSCINPIDKNNPDMQKYITVTFGEQNFITKSANPDENKVTDISLMVFDEYGTIEEFRWIPSYEINSVMRNGLRLRLATGKSYSFYGCVNFGYKVYADNVEELDELTYHLIYPDDFRNGIPMCIIQKDVMVNDGSEPIRLPLRRMMSKISLRIDRSLLAKDVKMNVTRAHIGNCPKIINVFKDSRATDGSHCFPAGYSKSDFQTSIMNDYDAAGMSGEVSLYMLENMQGKFDGADGAAKEFPENDIRRKICSYIEIEVDYRSNDKVSLNGPLKYRFYLGENDKDLNIERNCNYRITVKPHNDGLSKDGWCIDKSGMCTFVKEIKLSESNIVFDYEGQNKLIETTIAPSDATFQRLSWSSSNERVAEVSDNGVITAKGEGSCTITCVSIDGGGAKASCEVTCRFKDYYLKLFPSEYVVGNIGEKIHIWCEFFPPNTPFNVGLEELEFDKNRGIYDYIIDKDGHGVTLTLKNPGRGMLYMTAGQPINDSRMVVIEVNQP